MGMVIFIHGLDGNPHGTKSQALAEIVPAGRYLAPNVRDLGPATRLARLEALLDEHRDSAPHLLIGSSLGGWLAAVIAEKRPAEVERLVLLVPAVNFRDLPPPEPETLKPDAETFFAESLQVPSSPTVPATIPTTVIEARDDTIIPSDAIRRWLADHPHAEHQVWPDEHRLANSVDRLVELVRPWIGA